MKFRWLVIAAAIVLTGCSAGLIFTAVNQSIALQQQGSVIATLSANNDALRAQVEEQGEVPVAPPADSVVGEQGPAGNAGPQGPRGLPGDDGQDGEPGPAGPAGQNGTNGTDGPPGPQGAQGPAGADGAPGAPPTSWTFTWLGTSFACTRSEPFDATAPTYECHPV